MITKPTVLVLGAGASKMYGFPSGAELRRLIMNRLQNVTPELYKEYGYMGFEPREVKEFVSSFGQSGVRSIDAFLEHRNEFIKIGKTAIAEALLPYENETALFGQNTDWYGYLLDKMNVSVDRFVDNKLTVVTFNYDRSLEWYFFKALQARYGVNEDTSLKMMKSVPVIHLYGTLGGLPWENNGRPYIPSIERPQIYAARDRIRVIHEDVGTDEVFSKALEVLSSATRIVFLGFGYSKTNIQRLQPAKWTACAHPLRGTAYDLTEQEKAEAKKWIGHNTSFGGADWDVLRFLREKGALEG